MTSPNAEPRPPEDYSRFLALNEPPLLVGGQAVNLWGLYYWSRSAELAPFVSRDIDVLGQRETLQELANVAGLKPHYFSLRPPSNEVGYILPKDESEQPLLIEVLRWVKGVNQVELESDAVTFLIGDNVPVRVPSPIVLLKAKLANLATISQEGRQDAKHVRILFRILPGYLGDLVKTVKEGKRTERQLVNLLGKLLEIVSDGSIRQILQELQLNPQGLFSELPDQDLPKVQAFKQHQLSSQASRRKR